MKKNKQSSAAIMLHSLMRFIIIVTLLLGAAIIIAVGHQLLEEVQTTTSHITASLKQTDIDGDDDWESWRKNSTLDTSATYVYVHNKRADAKVSQYFSPHAEKVLKVTPTKVPFLTNVYYRPGIGLLYHRMVHARGIYCTLWQNMNPQLAVLLRVIEVTAILLAVTLLATPLYIRRLTKRLTDPLTTLSHTTQMIAGAKEPGAMWLPVPAQPTEVTELAGNFNELLSMLNERQEQQKLFVMNAAHELRTPIATIRSHAQLIERHGENHPEIITKSVGYITEESRQIQQLIDELLQLSCADRLALDLTPLDLSATVTTIMQKIAGTFEQTVTTEIQPDIHITGNESAIEQILVNLVTNAAKYSPAASQITVTLTQQANEAAALAVKDQGSGISAEDKSHIFERFYRSADVRGTVAGTGLGLAIATQLAQLSNSELTVADDQPQGTIFTLIFSTK
ncbi:sensor histidine kinase [Oenococcus oeni]|uniref:sensor histidine kinase n=2 Tax=Oenococcus oeni TaxID=1247 RepID=UPI00050E8607|nr:HAMP domain-containing sensor histidine kinase [Oenococcus oeni]KGH65686.1 histidine kinase [Oenococcus oeni IOEB_B16]OIL79102.1 two-component sensor histidine kinase [Oenococcus oeni]OIL91660.1 two-component sensor histidine kinase [Oenococcus oeni]PDH77520.1 histidine kinase [Oenococcus oeni]PDH77539.1 histidine kinase [Oenococcus oeni]